MTVPFAILLLVAGATGAAAHGGTLHKTTPETENYIRTKVASCSDWKAATGKMGKVQLLVAPGAKAAASTKGADVKGTVTLYQYLYGNCSVATVADTSAGATFNVSLSRGGKPLSNMTLVGIAVTESCAAGGGQPFRFDPKATPLDNAENLLWFHNHTLAADGRVAGNGANDGAIRTTGDGAARAVMLVDSGAGAALACCDLTLAGPATSKWADSLAGKGKACPKEDSDGMMAHGSANASDYAAGAQSHAGHNHGAPSKSSAAKAPASAFTATLLAAAAGLLML